jgi:hypothetical protein
MPMLIGDQWKPSSVSSPSVTGLASAHRERGHLDWQSRRRKTSTAAGDVEHYHARRVAIGNVAAPGGSSTGELIGPIAAAESEYSAGRRRRPPAALGESPPTTSTINGEPVTGSRICSEPHGAATRGQATAPLTALERARAEPRACRQERRPHQNDRDIGSRQHVKR